MKAIVSQEARQDVARAIRIYNAKPGRFGPAIRAEFRMAVSEIAECPRLYSPFEYGPPGLELRVYYIRRFDLCVIYQVREKDVRIVNVVHANMPPEKWITRSDPIPPTEDRP
jgi:plasmid stabilization system protein ParE